jgi:hypothetical protein
MADLSRRGFLTRTSLGLGVVGVGMAGGLGLQQLLTRSAQPGAPLPLPELPSVSLPLLGGPVVDSMIVHVRDISRAEISLMVGTREIVFTDPQLVGRLVQVSNRAEG